MTFQPYNVVPGTQIIHSTIDSYEYSDEVEEKTYTVKLQCDNDGVYLESSSKHYSSNQPITEYMSITHKDLALCIAKKILETYGVN